MNKRSDFRMGLGASSILMIVIIIVLTTFGVLSLASAQADLKLTEKTEKMMTEYYSAENKVQELYGKIDSVIASGYGMEYRNAALKSLDDTITFKANGVLEFFVPVNKNQQITVQLQMRPGNDPRYDVISQKLVMVGTWTPEVDLNTWNKE